MLRTAVVACAVLAVAMLDGGAQANRAVRRAEVSRKRQTLEDGTCIPVVCNATIGDKCSLLVNGVFRQVLKGNDSSYGHCNEAEAYCTPNAVCATKIAAPSEISCGGSGHGLCAQHNIRFGRLMCHNQKCQALPRPGDACTVENEFCEPARLECRDGQCRGLARGAVCVTPTQAEVGRVANRPLCEPGFTCQNKRCEPAHELGEDCTFLAGPGLSTCRPGLDCVGDDRKGKCQHLFSGAVDALCVTAFDCAPGLYCHANNPRDVDGSGTCKTPPAGPHTCNPTITDDCGDGVPCRCFNSGEALCPPGVVTPPNCDTAATAWATCIKTNDCYAAPYACPPCHSEEVAVQVCEEAVTQTVQDFCDAEAFAQLGNTFPDLIDNNAGKAVPTYPPTPPTPAPSQTQGQTITQPPKTTSFSTRCVVHAAGVLLVTLLTVAVSFVVHQ